MQQEELERARSQESASKEASKDAFDMLAEFSVPPEASKPVSDSFDMLAEFADAPMPGIEPSDNDGGESDDVFGELDDLIGDYEVC